ncbi:MAG: hypothetical protein ABSD30_20985 [Candidatus Binatus sp.]
MNNISPQPDKFAKLIKEHPGPIVMLNLLKFRAKAKEEEGTGAEAYSRYGSRVVKMIEALGGKVLWSGRPESVLIGDSSDEWGRSRTRAISKSEDSIRNGIDAGISANPQAS